MNGKRVVRDPVNSDADVGVQYYLDAAAEKVALVSWMRYRHPRFSGARWVFLGCEGRHRRGPRRPPGVVAGRTLEELTMTLVERLAEWPKRWLQEGIEQGLAHQRAVLCRQAALRFGAETAARMSPAVERITDPEGLAAAGEWIVRAGDGDELVARLTQIAEGDTP